MKLTPKTISNIAATVIMVLLGLFFYWLITTDAEHLIMCAKIIMGGIASIIIGWAIIGVFLKIRNFIEDILTPDYGD